MYMSNKTNKLTKKRVYKNFNYPFATDGEKTLLTGIRGKSDSDKVYISGFYVPQNQPDTTSFIYYGCDCGKGKFYDLNYPSVNNVPTITNLYGPNNGEVKDTIQVVGNYTIDNVTGTKGCLYEGLVDNSGTWTTIIPTPLSANKILNTICHSTMGNIIVGNYDTILIQGKAFLYDIKTKKYYNITNKHAISITAYGIWHNECNSYTICGGYTTKEKKNIAYIVNWDNKKKILSDWQTYNYNNDDNVKITHFDGITGGIDKKTYNLTGDWLGNDADNNNNDCNDDNDSNSNNDSNNSNDNNNDNTNESGFFAQVKFCEEKKRFEKKAVWYPIIYPKNKITSGNSVYKNIVIGVYADVKNNSINGYISRLKCV